MITKKLFEIQQTAQALVKSEENPFFKSKYLPLEEILNYYMPIFNKNKIWCYNYTKNELMITRLQDLEDDSFIESEFKIINIDPQKRGAEISYWRRYNLGQLLNINAEDDDGNKTQRNLNTIIEEIKNENEIKMIKKLHEEWKKFAYTNVERQLLESVMENKRKDFIKNKEVWTN